MTTIERLLILAALLGIFVLDGFSPLGIPIWLLYLFPVLYFSLKAGRTETLIYLSLISAFMVADFFLSPPGARPLFAGLNRILWAAALWGLSFFNLRRNEMMADLRAANEKIRESETNLRTIFDRSHDAIFIHDQEGRIIDLNRKARKMYGIDAEQAGALSITDLSSPDNLLDSTSEIWRLAGAGANQLFEWKARRPKDNSVFDVEVFLTRIRLREKIAILATVRDITERKQMEDALRLTRFSVDRASVCAYLVTREARFLYVNEQTCRTLGYSREELLAMTVHDLDPDYPLAVWDEHWADLKKKGSLHFETSQHRKDGTLVPMDMTLNFLAFGGREYNVAFALDISERKRAEQEIARISRRNELVLRSAGEGILGLDAQGRVTFINPAAAAMLGYGEQELIGSESHAKWHHRRADGSDYPAEECPIYQAYREGAIHAGEDLFWRKNGASFPVAYTSVPFREEGLPGAVVTFRDITERKRAEEALRQAYAGLETQVRERTRELATANRELRLEISERLRTEEALQASERRLRAILNSIPDLAWLKDTEGRFILVNEAFGTAAAKNPEELVGKTDFDAWPAELAEKYRADDREVIEMHTRKRIEEPLARPDGSRAWIETIKTPFYNEKGEVIGTAGIARDTTERRRMEEEIRHMAQHDVLTGLPNRRLLMDIIAVGLAEARRHRSKLAILFIDLDRFKDINDTLGHETGDHLLKKVAGRLKETVRESDTVARIGGDEFNILLTDLNRMENALPTIRKIIDCFQIPFSIAGHELHVTTSIGISIYPDDSEEINTLFRYADIALYHAKELGKNSYQFYNPAINIRSLEKMRLEGYLRQTLNRDELVVHYQPLVDIKTQNIVCVEALVRWRHPELGLLEPERFIPLAEESGFITAIDEWMLRSVCARARAWLDAGLPPLCISVNLSAREFRNPELVDIIARNLAETNLPPESLDLEITEGTAMHDIEHAISRLDKLAAMGVGISIDDFGTGYSSLNYLKRMPVKKLKIDRSFIKDIAVDPDDRAIIRAVTAMAHNMKLKVVAEGVETAAQLAFLHETGCDEAQGFLFGKPLAAEELEELLLAEVVLEPSPA